MLFENIILKSQRICGIKLYLAINVGQTLDTALVSPTAGNWRVGLFILDTQTSSETINVIVINTINDCSH